MAENAKKIALKWVDDNSSMISELNRKIWEFAELGLLEYKTSNLISSTLKGYGFEVEQGEAGMPSALVSVWGSGKPVIGIQGELDALPSLSQKDVPYEDPIKKGDPGHGCGHNIYASSGVGGVIASKIAMEETGLPGTVKFLGTPAEETLVGKVFMVRDVVFDGVDASLGHHPSQRNGVSLAPGNAMNSVKFEFFGRSSHAASDPENGISAMDGVELMNVGANFLREHVIQETRIHYVVENGGHEPNVVPPYARSWYYVRAPERILVDDYY